MKKYSLISVVLLLLSVGCRPSTPEQLIKRFDTCFLKYGQHAFPNERYPKKYGNPIYPDFSEIFNRIDSNIIDYNVPINSELDASVLKGSPQGQHTWLRIAMFSPFNMTRDELFTALQRKDYVELSPVTDHNHNYYLKEYLELSPVAVHNHNYYLVKTIYSPDNVIVSYYNEIIYIFFFPAWSIPENNKVILDHAFGCIDEATGR